MIAINSLICLDFDHVEPLNLKHKTSDQVLLRKSCTATLTCIPPSSNIFPVKWTNLSMKTRIRSRRFPNGSLEIRNAGRSDSNSRITCEFTSDQGVSGKRAIGILVLQSGIYGNLFFNPTMIFAYYSKRNFTRKKQNNELL